MKEKLPLSITAERMLKYVFVEQKEQGISRAQIEIALNIDTGSYIKACQQLIDYKLVEGQKFHNRIELIAITQAGRQAVHDDFKRPETGTNIGAIIGINSGNLNAVGTANNQSVQQIFEQKDSESLRLEINKALNDLLSAVSDQLDLQQRAVYMQEAANLEQEIAKKEPNKSTIARALSVLTFGNNLNGSLALGEKAIGAIAVAAPYIVIIANGIIQLLHSIVH